MAKDNDKKKPTDPKKPDDKKNNGNFTLITLVAMTIFATVLIRQFISGPMAMTSTSLEISYNEFVSILNNDELVEKVELKPKRYIVYIREGTKKHVINSIITKEDKRYKELKQMVLEYKDIDFNEPDSSTGVLQGVNKLRKNGFFIEHTAAILHGIVDANRSLDNFLYFTGAVEDPNLVELLLEKDIKFSHIQEETNYITNLFFEFVLPFIFIYIIFTVIMRSMSKKMGSGGGGFMNIGKSNAKLYNMEKKTGITFNDVAGQEEAKESLTEIVDVLHHPEKYVEIGAKQPKGALLVGPPGTGKTLLAKAVAGEAKVPFFSLTGSEFVEMYVGVGASRVRDLFKIANQNAPCIIFIDEIDAIGKSRDNQMGSNDEREQTLNQLLSEMDGFDTSKGIVILAATNRPEILDKALLRPGRFDRRVIVEKPDLIGREAILEVHSKKVKLDEDVNLKHIALATSGAVGADLANMINEAALRAVRLDRKKVKQEDLMEAVEVVIAGKEKKDRILSPKEKRLVAFHEVGHAITAAFEKNAQPVQKITIVPRTMGSLGYVMQMPEEEKFLMTKEEFLSEITVFLGGRAAEVIIFNTSTTGAANDIERATSMARSMVSMYGMSEKFGIMGLERIQDKYLGARRVATCSPETEAEMDKETKIILDTCYEKALEIIRDHKETVHEIAKFLLEKENISGEEFMKILKENNPDFVEKKPPEVEKKDETKKEKFDLIEISKDK